MIDNRAQIQTH